MKSLSSTEYSNRRILIRKLCGVLLIALLIWLFLSYESFLYTTGNATETQTTGTNTQAPFHLDEDSYGTLSETEKEVLRKTEYLLHRRGYDETSFRYKAIQTGLLMLNWKYSKPSRWHCERLPDGTITGSRDCSSFVYTCYTPYTSFPEKSKYTELTTASLLTVARGTGVGYRYSSLVKHLQERYGETEWINHLDDDPARFLIPGDLILLTGNWERPEGIVHVMIYLCDGYVLHATNTGKQKILIEKYDGWVIYGEEAMMRSGQRYVIPIPAAYDRGMPFNPEFCDYKYAKRIVKCTVPIKNILDIISSTK